jgi:hypothetical protein
MPRQKTKGFYACRNCGRFPVWSRTHHTGDVCECETYIPQNADEKATAVVKAVFNEVLKKCRPIRWGLDGLEKESPKDYEELIREARDVVVRETYKED